MHYCRIYLLVNLHKGLITTSLQKGWEKLPLLMTKESLCFMFVGLVGFYATTNMPITKVRIHFP